MQLDVLTLFPEWFEWFRTQRHVRNAIEQGHEIRTFDLRCPEFPHEPTADQLFDEDQIWAYIKLGRHIVLDMCEKVFAITPTQTVWNAADLDGAKLADRVSERRKGRGHETTSNPSGNVVADVSVAKTGGEESVAATVAPTRDDHPATAIHAVAAGNGVTVKTKRRTRKRRQRHQPGKPR